MRHKTSQEYTAKASTWTSFDIPIPDVPGYTVVGLAGYNYNNWWINVYAQMIEGNNMVLRVGNRNTVDYTGPIFFFLLCVRNF